MTIAHSTLCTNLHVWGGKGLLFVVLSIKPNKVDWFVLVGQSSISIGYRAGAAPEKKEGGGGGGGGAELRLDWDRSFLVPMKYCLRFKEESFC